MTSPEPGANALLPPDVLDALQQGNKIEAIKRLRQHTGLGLKESKDLIDAAEPRQVNTNASLSPGQVGSGASIRGWLLMACIVAILYFLLRGR